MFRSWGVVFSRGQNVEEDNGFTGGVLSSVGPFYASCPCGWDFSFYHVLIKRNTIYDAEVLSLPENFMLRYWSPNTADYVEHRPRVPMGVAPGLLQMARALFS